MPGHMEQQCHGSKYRNYALMRTHAYEFQALVAGTNLILSPEGLLLLSNMNFLSPDSVCHSFDSRANGYGRGEGAIAIVLKPLSGAIENGDTIRAVIRATGSNQDGKTPGLTQPSTSAQESLIRSVYEKAKLDFSKTRYVEAHGDFPCLIPQ